MGRRKPNLFAIVRLEKEEHQRLHRLARLRGLDLSNLLRQWIRAGEMQLIVEEKGTGTQFADTQSAGSVR